MSAQTIVQNLNDPTLEFATSLFGGFAAGAAVGALGESASIPLGIASAISFVANSTLNFALGKFAEKSDLTIHSFLLLSAACDTLCALVTVISCVAIGIINPTDILSMAFIPALYLFSVGSKLKVAFEMTDKEKQTTVKDCLLPKSFGEQSVDRIAGQVLRDMGII